MLQLAEIPSIVGVKEASGDITQIATIASKAPKDFFVLSGDDAMTVPAMSVGAKGVISVTSNIMPDTMISMVRAMQESNITEARRIHGELLPLLSVLFIETNPIPIKTAVRLQGRPAGPFRLPLCDMTAEHLNTLKGVLAEYKLI
jgi:4-hydroxy-tetrahydrodipicolinate synthase